MKELYLKERLLLEKDGTINVLKNNLKEVNQIRFDNSPISTKNNHEQKRNNTSSNYLLTPPQIEIQKCSEILNNGYFKSPRTDIMKKNKSDCYTKIENSQENVLEEGQMTIKKIENVQNNQIFTQNSCKSNYKIIFPAETKEFLKTKINKENLQPLSPIPHSLSKNNSEKMIVSEYLQNNKKNKKVPLITTIELFKSGEDKKNDSSNLLKSPKEVFQKSTGSEKIKSNSNI